MFNEPVTAELRLEIELRNEKIRRKEDYISFQLQLNAVKKRYNELAEELIRMEKEKRRAGCSECDDLWEKIEYLEQKIREQGEELREKGIEIQDLTSALDRVSQKFHQVMHLKFQSELQYIKDSDDKMPKN